MNVSVIQSKGTKHRAHLVVDGQVVCGQPILTGWAEPASKLVTCQNCLKVYQVLTETPKGANIDGIERSPGRKGVS